jgi:hypothetical protein
MNRRDLLIFSAGATAWPFAARAQQKAMPVIGWLSSLSSSSMATRSFPVGATSS